MRPRTHAKEGSQETGKDERMSAEAVLDSIIQVVGTVWALLLFFVSRAAELRASAKRLGLVFAMLTAVAWSTLFLGIMSLHFGVGNTDWMYLATLYLGLGFLTISALYYGTFALGVAYGNP